MDIAIHGIYVYESGSVTTVVENFTSVPGLQGYSFTEFDNNFGSSGDTIAIQTSISDGTNDEIALVLATTDGTLTLIADTVNSASPSTGLVVDELDEVSFDGTSYVFGAADDNNIDPNVPDALLQLVEP